MRPISIVFQHNRPCIPTIIVIYLRGILFNPWNNIKQLVLNSLNKTKQWNECLIESNSVKLFHGFSKITLNLEGLRKFSRYYFSTPHHAGAISKLNYSQTSHKRTPSGPEKVPALRGRVRDLTKGANRAVYGF